MTPSTASEAPRTERHKLETRIVRVRLRELKFLEEVENARYMEKAEFDRPVVNIRRDGCLIYRGKVFLGQPPHQGRDRGSRSDRDLVGRCA